MTEKKADYFHFSSNGEGASDGKSLRRGEGKFPFLPPPLDAAAGDTLYNSILETSFLPRSLVLPTNKSRENQKLIKIYM